MEIWRGSPVKHLTVKLDRQGGRNNFGRITSYHRGGGHSRRYRIIDFYKYFAGIPAVVRRVERDPNRNAFLMLLVYSNGFMTYSMFPKSVQLGSILVNYTANNLKPGNTLFLSQIPIGFSVHSVEIKPGEGARMARSGGNKAQILARSKDLAILRLPSGEVRKFSASCKATVGVISSVPTFYLPDHKAGRSRWLNWRPHVRGVAMNPIDHPHGGGEGRSSGGRKSSTTPWGALTKGVPTRDRAKNSAFIMITRRTVRAKQRKSRK